MVFQRQVPNQQVYLFIYLLCLTQRMYVIDQIEGGLVTSTLF